jgi:hypothetical protein
MPGGILQAAVFPSPDVDHGRATLSTGNIEYVGTQPSQFIGRLYARSAAQIGHIMGRPIKMPSPLRPGIACPGRIWIDHPHLIEQKRKKKERAGPL